MKSYTKKYRNDLFYAIKEHDRELTILSTDAEHEHLANMRQEYQEVIMFARLEYDRIRYQNLGASVLHLWQPTVKTIII